MVTRVFLCSEQFARFYLHFSSAFCDNSIVLIIRYNYYCFISNDHRSQGIRNFSINCVNYLPCNFQTQPAWLRGPVWNSPTLLSLWTIYLPKFRQLACCYPLKNEAVEKNNIDFWAYLTSKLCFKFSFFLPVFLSCLLTISVLLYL